MEPREISLEAANRSMDELRDLFDLAGTTVRLGGWALAAFRRALMALRGKLADVEYATGVIEALREEIARDTERTIVLAWSIGERQAQAELEAYGYSPVRAAARGVLIASAVAGVLAQLDAQIGRARAMIVTRRADDGRVLGDGTRVGILTPTPILLELSDATVRTSVQAHQEIVVATSGRDRFRRQAVCTIDERTTDCCLRVHGQVRDWDEMFVLKPGVPRFADELLLPPFHWYCRTVQVLVPADAVDDPLTLRMRAAAQAELDARERTKRRVEINPSFAFSGRAG